MACIISGPPIHRKHFTKMFQMFPLVFPSHFVASVLIYFCEIIQFNLLDGLAEI